jgi:chemotaxis protein MotB
MPVNSAGQTPTILPPSAPVVQKPNPASKTQEAVKQQQREKMRNVAKEILEVMAPLIEQGKVRVLESSRGVSIEINDSILFAPGQALLQPPWPKPCSRLPRCWLPRSFRSPSKGIPTISRSRTCSFPSNWELSAVRATTVLRLFADAGVASERLTAIGYADTRPVEPNVLADGRARNRRVTILIESEIPEKGTDITPADRN